MTTDAKLRELCAFGDTPEAAALAFDTAWKSERAGANR